MTPFSKKYTKIITLTGFVLFAITLSACGTTEGLEGFAGEGGETATEDSAGNPTGDTPSGEVSTETPIPPATGHIIFSSSRDGQTDLYMTSPDGLELTRLTTSASVEEGSQPRISPDGSKVAFVSTIANNTDIYILDINSGVISQVTNAPEKDSSPSWSPDSQRLAFESFRDGNLEIYATTLDGSSVIRLTNDPAGDSNPVWSPVSNEILFASNRFGNSDLLLTDLNGVISPLTTSTAPDNSPAWSPDGRFIAFESFSGDYSNICLIGRDGLNQRCITTILAEYGVPVWSWDGSKVASNSLINGTYGIHVFDIASGSVTQLTQPGIEPRGFPAWSPDNLRLVFQAQSGGDMDIYHALILTNEFTRITAIPGYDGEPVWASR